jgi:hypothetical protein
MKDEDLSGSGLEFPTESSPGDVSYLGCWLCVWSGCYTAACTSVCVTACASKCSATTENSCNGGVNSIFCGETSKNAGIGQ